MKPILQHYVEEYDKVKSYLTKTLDPLSLEKSEAAFELFLKNGFPSTKEASWAGIAKSRFLQHKFYIALPSTDQLLASNLLPKPWEPSAIRFVFVNGHFSKTLSSSLSQLPDGLYVETFAQSHQPFSENAGFHSEKQESIHSNSFAVMNQAFSQDGILIRVADDHHIEPLIELCCLGDFSVENLPLLVAIRHRIQIGKNSRIRFLERYWSEHDTKMAEGNAALFVNVSTTLKLGESANVVWAQNVQAAQAYIQVGELNVSQDAESHLTVESFMQGGGLIRHTVPIYLSGQGAFAQAQSLTLAKESNNIDHQVLLHHQASSTRSVVDYRAIADDKSRVGFRGEVHAVAGIGQVEAKQNSRNLLLSNQATIDTQPRLELLTEDLMCTHGATVGSLDAEALFYLQTRGISILESRLLLIEAFSQSILDKMSILSSARLQ